MSQHSFKEADRAVREALSEPSVGERMQAIMRAYLRASEAGREAIAGVLATELCVAQERLAARDAG